MAMRGGASGNSDPLRGEVGRRESCEIAASASAGNSRSKTELETISHQTDIGFRSRAGRSKAQSRAIIPRDNSFLRKYHLRRCARRHNVVVECGFFNVGAEAACGITIEEKYVQMTPFAWRRDEFVLLRELNHRH
jgi:hypothetical protein